MYTQYFPYYFLRQKNLLQNKEIFRSFSRFNIQNNIISSCSTNVIKIEVLYKKICNSINPYIFSLSVNRFSNSIHFTAWYILFRKKKKNHPLFINITNKKFRNKLILDRDHNRHVCKKIKGRNPTKKLNEFFSLDGTRGTKINRVTRVRARRPSVYTIPGRVPRIMNNLTRSWSAMQYKIDFMDSGCKCARARALILSPSRVDQTPCDDHRLSLIK